MTFSSEVLTLEVDGHVATLWLDREEARNAMGSALWRALPQDVYKRQAEGACVLEGLAHVGGLEELLGGHATAVQARTSYLVALDDRDVKTGGRTVEGGGVTSGSSSDHDHIELLDLVCHGLSLRFS